MQDILNREIKVGDLVYSVEHKKYYMDDTYFGIVISEDKIIRRVITGNQSFGWKVEKPYNVLKIEITDEEIKRVYSNITKIYNNYMQHSIICLHNYNDLFPGAKFRIKETDYVYLGRIEVSIIRVADEFTGKLNLLYSTNGEAFLSMRDIAKYHLLNADGSLDLYRLMYLLALARERNFKLSDRNWRKKAPFIRMTQKLLPEVFCGEEYKIDVSKYDIEHLVDLTDTGLVANGIDYTNVKYKIKFRKLNREGMEEEEKK